MLFAVMTNVIPAADYEVRAEFENRWMRPPLSAGYTNANAGAIFGGHAGAYRLPGTTAAAVVPATPGGSYQLVQSSFGQAFEGRKPDFQLGQIVEAPPGVNTAVAPEISPASTAFYVPSRRIVIASDAGLVRVAWKMIDGSTQERVYLISAVPQKRPARIFWTEEPYNAPTVSLRDKYVVLHYNTVILPPEVDTSTTNQPLKQYVRGLWVDEQHILHAKEVTGMVIMEYFETGSTNKQVGWEVVEASQPQVNQQNVDIGSRLVPLETYYGENGLIADVRKGMSTLAYQHATTSPDGPKNAWIFAIGKSVDAPYQLEIYWKHKGIMDVEWPFELDWYSADWPADEFTQIYVRGGNAVTNATVTIPNSLSVQLEDFQEPARHAFLSNDDQGQRLFYTKGPGRALLRYTANDNVWFQVIRSVDHADANLFNQTSLPSLIGREIRPARVVTALTGDGINTALALPASTARALTLEAWVMPQANQAANLALKHATATPSQRYWQLSINTNSHFEATVWNGANAVRLVGKTFVGTGVWQHVAVTVPENGPMRLFVNGVEDADAVTVTCPSGGQFKFLGAVSGDNGQAFKGLIADLRVWSRLVTPAEIMANMNQRLLGYPNGLYACFNFEGGDATSVVNRITGAPVAVTGGFVSTPVQWNIDMSRWGTQPGYVHASEGDRYNYLTYTYPQTNSTVFPVNSGTLEVWWSEQFWQQGMPVGVFWPALVVRYTNSWDVTSTELVIAGQNTDPAGQLPEDMLQPSVYYQNDFSLPGFNPNEEHALILSGKVYALRDDLNANNSSAPYVLVGFTQPGSGVPGMKTFHVVQTNATYGFSRSATAGTLLQAPMPLTMLPKCDQSTVVSGPVWRDRKLDYWAMAAGADGISPTNVVIRYFYPVQTGFYFPGEAIQPSPGSQVPWLSRNGSHGAPIDYVFNVVWPTDVPVLRIGETLVDPKRYMPAIRGQKSVSVIYQQTSLNQPGSFSVTLLDPTRERSVPLNSLPADIPTETVKGKKYFPTLPPHLRNRLFYDPDAAALKLVGVYVVPAAGEAYLELNVLNDSDRAIVSQLSADLSWQQAVSLLADSILAISEDNMPFDSLALSAALAGGSGYVTIAFNSSTNLCDPADPISLAIIKVEGPLYRGEIKVIQSENPLDEYLTLQHSGDFAGHSENYEFEWRTLPPDVSGMPPGDDPASWTLYKAGANLPRVVMGGAGLMTLSDNYFICRYRPLNTNGPTGNLWSEWTDPMLAEGWIKRALNGINPFEQRIKNLQDNQVNTVVSMVGQAGARWVGDVALNLQDINAHGLIEIYETILNRGKMLSINSGFNYGPANDALLLAAGRIHDLYMILGNEAYADCSDPTISFSTADRQLYGSEWTSIFCFMNQVPTLLEEELCLLRGRDDSLLPSVKTYPIYNRLIWNFTSGMNGGESAYALNYAVRNEDGDPQGVIDEVDARKLYPQGHGDAWGHYLTAIKGYYDLLANTNFTWIPRIESTLVGGVPVSVDYYDERKFAEAAAARARTGVEILGLTHRSVYSESTPNSSAGFRDVRSDRAWGVAEWGSRAGQAALFDWVVANSLLPEKDTNSEHVGIQIIDRTTVPELKEILTSMDELQVRMDHADKGFNPLGLDKNAVPFDLDPIQLDAGKTHFEQLYDRSMVMLNNAVRVFERAQSSSQLIRRQSDSLEDLKSAASDGEDDYNNQLIAIFGYPYSDDCGPGKTYPQGYDGPDLYHFQYVDAINLLGLEVPTRGTNVSIAVYNYEFAASNTVASFWANTVLGTKIRSLNTQLDTNSVVNMDFHIAENGLMIKPPEWTGARRSQGEIQLAYSDFILAWYDLTKALVEYNALLGDISADYTSLDARLDYYADGNQLRKQYGYVISGAEVTSKLATAASGYLEDSRDLLLAAMSVPEESIPKSLIAGMALGGDTLAPARAAIKAAEQGVRASFGTLKKIALGVSIAADIAKSVAESTRDGKLSVLDQNSDILNLQLALEKTMRTQESKQIEVQSLTERLSQAQERYRLALTRGERLIAERTSFRAQTATAIQADRYADMTFRIFRNDALGKYKTSYDLAARYVYLAAKAYAYETGQWGMATNSSSEFLADIVRAQSLGRVQDGEPLTGGVTGDPGLADVMARMKANWEVLQGRLSFNNPSRETSRFSLRSELFRIGSPEDASARATSDESWRRTLWSYKVDNLAELSEFRRYCLPFSPMNAQEPALVIPFSTTIEARKNFFGWDLAGGDHAYDSTHFATKIRSVGVWFSNFNTAFGGGLGFTPRVFLIPVGNDIQREPGDYTGLPRIWKVVDQALPVPFNIETGQLNDPDWQPIIDGLSEGFATIRKYPSLRAYHDSGVFSEAEMCSDARLVGRSVWNTRWVLIIPASTLHGDSAHALEWFINGVEQDGNGVKDIKILFQTYSYSGN